VTSQFGSSPEPLTSDELIAYEQRRADRINAEPGNLSGCDCHICLNKGYTAVLNGKSIVNRECSCMGHRRSIWCIRASGLSEVVERCSFDTFQTPNPWQKNAKKAAINFLTDHDGKWFCTLGAVGAGKSHLCTAICGAMLNEGLEVRYMKWRDDAGRIKAAVNDSEEYEKLMEPLKRVKVLYIDDFFKVQKTFDSQGNVKHNVTSGDINLAFEILNHRYINRNLITIISSEKKVDELIQIDEAIGSRIYERSRDYCINLAGQDKNWRLK
jgi:DNA replication protein DnaC